MQQYKQRNINTQKDEAYRNQNKQKKTHNVN